MNAWERIYRNNLWNGEESLSGPGSGSAATASLVPALLDLVDKYEINSVLDVACGDGFWMPDLPNYVGIDLSDTAIDRARALHPERVYIVGDYLSHDLRADLIIMRDVLQHLSLNTAASLVARASKRCHFLLASTYRGGRNTGISEARLLQGKAYDNDLERYPFRLGQPIEVIPDGYAYHEGGGMRDERKFLGLWAV
jgi:SAM-dependent methyltransferase